MPSGRTAGEALFTAVDRMTTALGHRGPDGRGVTWCTPAAASGPACRVAFGHTRLAIIDLTDRAAQPMRAADGSAWITFNGEIYNYREVREQLRRRGVACTSESDTEVILR
jgi:asparagine synthase (glutamine-hydrolysing)